MSYGGRIFVTSDTHFGHRRILELCRGGYGFSSIEEHDEHLVQAWNATVRPKDTVWHLGDVAFGRQNLAILSRLNGLKKLVMGNHDEYPNEAYLEHFASIHGAVSMRGCIFTHIPIHPAQFYRFKANVHGHLHDKVVDDPRYISACVEHHNLRPVLLDELLKGLPCSTSD